MDNGEISLSGREFTRIKDRVYDVAGISLSDAKRTMVISRLTKIVRALNLKSFDAYVDYLERSAGSKDDQQAFVNALTTNLTRFYREDHHFDHMLDHMRGLISAKPRVGPTGTPRLRIWSAGCSTGQEPYTIGMALLNKFPELKRWDVRILATDIDTGVIAKAARGIYPESELNGLAPDRARLLEKKGDGNVHIPAEVKNLVTFKPLNLLKPWPVKGPFDIIFCRNVAIYFDKPTQAELFSRLGDVLATDGFLYIGHSETITANTGKFSLVGKTIYRATGAAKERNAA